MSGERKPDALDTTNAGSVPGSAISRASAGVVDVPRIAVLEATCVPQAKLTILPNGDHGVVQERPGEIVADIQAYLR
ncbi:MAG TPA: hypothetical protein VFT72_03865 [Opitutaceae bacterium]|nr:hypothetical protein [Opitutaceae bacterium]